MKKNLLSLLLLTPIISFCQKMAIEKIELAREKLIVYYTLDDNNPNHNYQVSLYSSKDNFAAPVTRVAGDVGNEVKPGAQKKIEWNMAQELGAYKGTLSVEVRAGVFVPVVKLSGFNPDLKYKRGKTYPILWTSGNNGGQIDIDLFDGQDRVHSDRNIPNTGKYEYAIPSSVKAGKDYKLKFTNTRNRDEYIFSPTFRIVPKIPFALKAGAAIVVLGGAAIILNAAGGGGEGNNGTTTQTIDGFPTELPD